MLSELLRSAEWIEGRSVRTDLKHPPAIAIAQAIRDLDGRHRTTVMLRNPGGAELLVAADIEGRCLLYARTGGGDFLAPASDPSTNGETTRMRVFGEEIDFPAGRTVSGEQAVEAALRFAFDGSLEPGLDWERTPKGLQLAFIRPRRRG